MTRKSCFLLLIALTGPGCLSTPPTSLDKQALHAPPVQMTAMAPAAPPVVTADQVTEANAVEAAKALSHELDLADNEHPAALATAKP